MREAFAPMNREVDPELRTAQASERPCQLYVHTGYPRPSRTQGHHRHPIFLQNEVYGRIQDPELLWVCGLCHDSVHDVLSWLLGRARKPDPMPGRKAVAEARLTLKWFTDNGGNIEDRRT